MFGSSLISSRIAIASAALTAGSFSLFIRASIACSAALLIFLGTAVSCTTCSLRTWIICSILSSTFVIRITSLIIYLR
ncbi:77aa long hypothetical protein [Pyrococcus horikoshii OT3]|uniref:Uncharacterized protein n=1 Tax=Pyrococcus horikoshii (strain ATCC 700860 / DSM 12428 / JCM 9974 / NBRC 100139 / OT-3) TaxID=70601 RepID=O74107_PYRHO|nr:77aa long hypothetical protein [Pyrococcus horikoshii OT3]